MPNTAKSRTNPVPLPADYVPHPHDVIIGRGRRANKHNENNTILQYLLNSYAAEYVDCTRDRKSDLITSVAQEIRTHRGNFIKKVHKKGGWHAVDDDLIRITTAQYLRNQVPQNFKSSKQFKRMMRDEKRQEKLAATVTVTPPTVTGTTAGVTSAFKGQNQLDELLSAVLRSPPGDRDTKMPASPQNEHPQEPENPRQPQTISRGDEYLDKRSWGSANTQARCFWVLEDKLDIDLSDPNPFEPQPVLR